MRRVRGVDYYTIADAAKELKISVATVRRYIRNATFPKPKRVYFASQSVAVFPADYIANARKIVEAMQRQK
jgi:Helix-turn-helix domain